MKRTVIILILLSLAVAIGATTSTCDDVLNRLYAFPTMFSGYDGDTISASNYGKCYINVDRKNASLYLVPTMFYLAKDGDRQLFFEIYSKLRLTNKGMASRSDQILLTTLYKRRRLLDNLSYYQLPYIYKEAMINGNVLSPFVAANRIYYRLKVIENGDGTSTLLFRGKQHNTQLVRGRALLDNNSGRVLNFHMDGEYDMIHFNIDGDMGSEGLLQLYVCHAKLRARISFLGNKISTRGEHVLDTKISLPDSMRNTGNIQLMDSIRPLPLSANEKAIIAKNDSLNLRPDTTEVAPQKKKRSVWKSIFWDAIGENLITKINGNFGSKKQGSFRVGPLFNPLYFGYSSNKGITYKLDLRGRYNLTDNSNFAIRVRGGYRFKRHQLYYSIPLTLTFNQKRNGYVKLEFRNGNRINNSKILDALKDVKRNDSIDWDHLNMQYFRDRNINLMANYDLNPYISLYGGIVVHKRTAINSQAYADLNEPESYKTVAPNLELTIRPWGWRKRMAITADYERGIRNFLGGEINYERWEFDASLIKDLKAQRSLSIRAGAGFYTAKSGKGSGVYFLDYSNFQENNMPGGWNDDWSGEFELLNSNWYNSSSYYLRGNATYQSPLLLLSWVPYLGRIVENERIYLNLLTVSKLNPYVEVGYGFTNRVLSVGVFTGFSPHSFEGVGLKFGFELFNNW